MALLKLYAFLLYFGLCRTLHMQWDSSAGEPKLTAYWGKLKGVRVGRQGVARECRYSLREEDACLGD